MVASDQKLNSNRYTYFKIMHALYCKELSTFTEYKSLHADLARNQKKFFDKAQDEEEPPKGKKTKKNKDEDNKQSKKHKKDKDEEEVEPASKRAKKQVGQ